jgi:hypothetical protein
LKVKGKVVIARSLSDEAIYRSMAVQKSGIKKPRGRRTLRSVKLVIARR